MNKRRGTKNRSLARHLEHPFRGGAESLAIAGKPQSGHWRDWAITRTGLCLLDAEATPRPHIEFFNSATHRTLPVLTLEEQPVRCFPSLSATADDRTIYYTQCDQQSEIRMVEFSRRSASGKSSAVPLDVVHSPGTLPQALQRRLPTASAGKSCASMALGKDPVTR